MDHCNMVIPTGISCSRCDVQKKFNWLVHCINFFWEMIRNCYFCWGQYRPNLSCEQPTSASNGDKEYQIFWLLLMMILHILWLCLAFFRFWFRSLIFFESKVLLYTQFFQLYKVLLTMIFIFRLIWVSQSWYFLLYVMDIHFSQVLKCILIKNELSFHHVVHGMYHFFYCIVCVCYFLFIWKRQLRIQFICNKRSSKYFRFNTSTWYRSSTHPLQIEIWFFFIF